MFLGVVLCVGGGYNVFRQKALLMKAASNCMYIWTYLCTKSLISSIGHCNLMNFILKISFILLFSQGAWILQCLMLYKPSSFKQEIC